MFSINDDIFNKFNRTQSYTDIKPVLVNIVPYIIIKYICTCWEYMQELVIKVKLKRKYMSLSEDLKYPGTAIICRCKGTGTAAPHKNKKH